MSANNAQRTALLVIDVQVGLIDGANPAHHKSEVLANIQFLLHRARASSTPVIYIQHAGDEGSSLEVHSAGWQIHPQIAPQEGETVLSKRASDSFYQTSLQQELEALGITYLVVTGCKTQYCIDTTIRRATTLGYDVTLASDSHTTTESGTLAAAQIVAHHNETLDDFGNDEHVVVVKLSSEIAF
ncbi:cysteine hydrolase family protein [Ktedonobacter racemifer]|uniref:Isochorismatase hydrolase n=1 Tax=Ktedonobacter racemifer DSM 44963 TaxID=485913 RepID=D6TT52_KTERA|nr:cysteine hydrolase family protein [Ktedonobacter racemifer]EFH83603.1 isochorismatase hydrolase [Ktedonobacter racemifer DSM 44963]